MNALQFGCAIVVLAVLIGGGLIGGEMARATEPNDSFAEATVLTAGTLSVDDDVSSSTSGDFPDTMVASLNTAGFITGENNDGGTWEGSLGSALAGIPINNDSSFWFIVTGYPDFSYAGDHDESGNYHVYVDIYDDFGFFEETIEFDGNLQPGSVDQFSLDGFNTFYSYNVEIDNTVGGSSVGDVDFFTFTGLTPGAAFSAEVTQEIVDDFDSILGWFNDTGDLIEYNDDQEDEEHFLSLLEGTVPASGKLTFAVTGYEDLDFVGDHGENAEYSLVVSLESASAPGDFNEDGRVDGRDFLLWQRGGSPSPLSAADLADWRANYDGPLEFLNAAQAVPEPGTVCLVGLVGCWWGMFRKAGR